MNPTIRSLKAVFYKMALVILRVYWFVIRPHTRGAKVIIELEGKVLLVKHSYGHQTWCFPGGGSKRGESFEDTAIREAKEEVGLTLKGVKFLGEFVSEREYKHDHVGVLLAQASSTEVHIDNDEIIDYAWMAYQEEKDWTPNSLRIWDIYHRHKSGS